MRGLFITGTDTGVGKTRVTTALAHALAVRGVDVRVRKPVESGCVDGPDGLVPQDATALHEAAGRREPLAHVCAFRLRAALSPERAAALEGVELGLDDLAGAARAHLERGSIVLVEGAGGLLSPIACGALNADLAMALGLPVLVVAADRLGMLNHTLLTLEALRARGLAVAGVVLSRPTPVDAAMDNAGELARWLGFPVLALPHGSQSGAAAWTTESAALGTIVDALVAP